MLVVEMYGGHGGTVVVKHSSLSRTSLPVPGNSEVNLCSVLSLGKDLSKITMPVIFNEPLSFLQRVAEYMEYAKLLKKAAQEETPSRRLQVNEISMKVYISLCHGDGE